MRGVGSWVYFLKHKSTFIAWPYADDMRSGWRLGLVVSIKWCRATRPRVLSVYVYILLIMRYLRRLQNGYYVHRLVLVYTVDRF